MTAKITKLSVMSLEDLRRFQRVTALKVYAITDTDAIVSLFEFKWDLGIEPLETTFDFVWNLNYETPEEITFETQFVWQLNAVKFTFPFQWDMAAASAGITAAFSFVWEIAEAYASPDAVVMPDWPITETWEWMTGIFRSKNGSEQRRSYIPRPIIRMQYNALALETEDMRQVRRVTEIDVGTIYPVPLTQYFDFLQVQAEASDTRVYFDPQRTNAIVGQTMAFIHAETYETILREVTAVYADGVELLSPIGVDTVGYHFACPVRYCRLNTGAGSSAFNSYTNTGYTFVSADRSAKFNRGENETVLRTVAGTVILDKHINADSGMREEFQNGVAVLDNLRAAPLLFANEATRRLQTVAFLIQREFNPELMDYWREFGETVRGQSVAFGLPSYRSDAAVFAPPALGDDTLTVFDTDAYAVFTQGGYFGIMFDTVNGREYRKVTAVSIVGTNTLLTLNAPLGIVAGDNVFETLSFIYLVRLASDMMTLTHNESASLITFEVTMVKE